MNAPLLAAVISIAFPSGALAQDALPRPARLAPGDAADGARLVADRQKSLCVLCHSGPFPNPHLQGNLAPDLKGIGARLSEDEIRLRVTDMKRLNPDSLMPTYVASQGSERVGTAWRGRPILAEQEIEHIVVYLASLKE
ncbi:putative cytochrome c, putative SoxX protein [Ancylobacter novellus DSM 506]|uniref:Cytochrome c, putative SoxX protein n=1 Tax=Ancylobacter novellus (strain ATCC 8093 / DSM 506 / JCM 20403 / CCM 1077 / IAM 12100 / NBRC 12443 / NCIMB 10456) TaxID=639283 RepID=D6ZZE3_ANCN5|nr:sulfur oxidation c-type cytochrome SoxX [Ancylobacter novellus]ADH89279.1 putative cytochrome c, putative SoxX protein [Ancylobacter novellus DSM 506]